MISNLIVAVLAGLASTALAAPTTAESVQLVARQGYDPNCTATYSVQPGDTCNKIRDSFNGTFTTDDFYAWNPQVNEYCSNLYPDEIVCVGLGEAGPPPACPVPVAPGLVSNCAACHLVVEGDNCEALAAASGVTYDDILLWNPSLYANCTNLQLDYNYCVGVGQI
ncbi:hypothetical protein F4778DRAFT_76052 [Xylariomycetidae sp. FL2044]|nr:hypothetical protein F4778DRAFT_76052 [Xylariomycetidae sp. FL2044]